eukprot:CAMPEP_0114360796 /NCGR_PEP_ID=MMETSP0101-20121206/24133_1 /TAXON_ID=38822 ORGANISM="Pteridomonas danica, Strain PT" /NCGR_SAMPLE_ID=MMETSP0101 /ASSEMBLY_ACC=CAM_ASM_000211 /LENGTH=64 /DNA_ID=CAMNT_0001505213 /DNA_START=105 /DNA_END=296 /DNA_ORIENTATION=-
MPPNVDEGVNGIVFELWGVLRALPGDEVAENPLNWVLPNEANPVFGDDLLVTGVEFNPVDPKAG